MRKKGVKVMMYLIGILLILIGGIIVFFQLPISKVKTEFDQKVNQAIREQEVVKDQSLKDYFTEEDIRDLPEPLKRHFRYCGYIEMKKPTYMNIDCKDVDFVLGDKKVKIDYMQYNFTQKPERLAYISASMMGIPFEGFDHYLNGSGGIKGVLAKTITLFDMQGEEMKKAGLVTCLAEEIMLPSFILKDYVTWEEVDERKVKATAEYYGIKVSGVFTFGESGEAISFYTSDRMQADEKTGTSKATDWECVFGDYKEQDGIKVPSRIKAIWHEEEGDLVYFDSNNFKLTYH